MLLDLARLTISEVARGEKTAPRELPVDAKKDVARGTLYFGAEKHTILANP
jgi:hypothetical protein